MNKKNILIVSYVFPPYPGIGGRRWAKFAKYLHRNGHNVFIISAKNPFNNISTFTENIKDIPVKNISYLPGLYPIPLISQVESVWDKLRYHFWYRILPLFTEGNYFDRSTFWKYQLHKETERLIKEKDIQNIIISGPPFHYIYYILLLKEKFPNIKFIVDYRDEWTFNNVHGFGLLSEKRKKIEFEREKFVCENADVITSCDNKILRYLLHNYKIKAWVHIPHAFDEDDFELTDNIIKDTNEISISYFGTVYLGTNKFFIELIKFLDELKISNKDLYDRIKIKFFLIDKFHYSDIILSHRERFEIHYNMPSKKLFECISASDFILSVLSTRAKDYFTSKFPEFFYMKKPIILYSDEGLVSKFIVDKKIGIHLPKENFHDALVDFLNNKDTYSYKNFNLSEWDYAEVTKKLEKLL